MNKNSILKPINEEDMKLINNFFVKNKEIYSINPITARELSNLFTQYRESDIRKIISEINSNENYCNILGYEKGYKIVTKNNRFWALCIINKKQDASNCESYNLKVLKSKIRNL